MAFNSRSARRAPSCDEIMARMCAITQSLWDSSLYVRPPRVMSDMEVSHAGSGPLLFVHLFCRALHVHDCILSHSQIRMAAAGSTAWLDGTGVDRYLPPIFLETNSDSAGKCVDVSIYELGLLWLSRHSDAQIIDGGKLTRDSPTLSKRRKVQVERRR